MCPLIESATSVGPVNSLNSSSKDGTHFKQDTNLILAGMILNNVSDPPDMHLQQHENGDSVTHSVWISSGVFGGPDGGDNIHRRQMRGLVLTKRERSGERTKAFSTTWLGGRDHARLGIVIEVEPCGAGQTNQYCVTQSLRSSGSDVLWLSHSIIEID